jgi:hypothetical protein
VNPTLVALAGTVTVAGTLTAALLVDRSTLCPPLPAAEVSFTVQASVPDPVMVELPHESELNGPCVTVAELLPLPCSFTVVVWEMILASAVKSALEVFAPGLGAGMLVMVTSPRESASDSGLKTTLKLRVLPGARVTGILPCPTIEKKLLETDISVIWTGVEP